MKTKMLGLAVLLVLVAASYYLIAATGVPTQPPVNVANAVQSDWDQYIEYTNDLTVSETVQVDIGGIETLRIIHLESADTNSSGIYYPFEFYMFSSLVDTVQMNYGEMTEFLAIGLEIATTDSLYMVNLSTSDTIGVKVSLIGE